MSTIYLNRYQVKSQLPKTSIANVFVAEDKILRREVVVKEMPQSSRHDDVPAGALLEGLVPIYDSGQENGHSIIVTGYLSGGTLAQRLESGPIPIQECVEITVQIAKILDYIHDKGLVHGNIKLNNILFSEKGKIQLSDQFTPLFRPEELVEQGVLFPTNAENLSPEQARGHVIDRRSDVYSLGVILFQMLTGTPPYQASTPIETVLQHLSNPVPQLNHFNRNLPEGFQSIIEKALDKKPDVRYPTAGELAEELELVFQGFYQLKSIGKHRRPKRLGRWILAGILAILVGVTGFWIYLSYNRLSVFGVSFIPIQTLIPFQGISTTTPTITEAVSIPTPTLTSTSTPDPTPIHPATNTLEASSTPTETPTPTATMIPAIVQGGADMIAVIDDNDIWLANLDGTNLRQLTQDGAPKAGLRWTPDGQGLIYKSEECYRLINIFTQRTYELGCFNALEISRDGSQIVVSETFEDEIDKQNRTVTYVLPYDLLSFSRLTNIFQADALGGCKLPKDTLDGIQFQWSQDEKQLAAIIVSSQGSSRIESILVYDVQDPCDVQPRKIDNLPDVRFTLRGYNDRNGNGILGDFDWDGDRFFAVTGDVNSYNVGDLVIYDFQKKTASVTNPIDGRCCYRDVRWSPDGEFLLFAFQDEDPSNIENRTFLYYVLYDAIGSGLRYQHIEFPDHFFDSPRTPIYPALRPALPLDTTLPWPSMETAGIVAALNNKLTLNGPIYDIAFSTDNTLLGIASQTGQSRVLSTSQVQIMESGEKSTDYVTAITYSPLVETSPIEPVFFAGFSDGSVRGWRLRDGVDFLFFLPPPLGNGHTASVSDLAFSLDGRYLASASYDNTVIVRRAQNGGIVFTLKGHENAVTSVVFTSDRIITGSTDRTVRIWDLLNGDLLYTLEGHSGPVWDLAVSPNEEFVASASGDRSIKVWQIRGGELAYTYEGHKASVLTVVFSDDRLLFSGGDDQSVRVWDLAANTEQNVWTGFDTAILSLAISDELLFVGGQNGAIQTVALP
jgi:WD40 repeat protein